MRWTLSMLAAILVLPMPGGAADAKGAELSFVVIGHIRSNANDQLNPLVPELLEEVSAIGPDLIFLTGDMIWGDIHTTTPDVEAVANSWESLDRELEALDIPVYRVPGNHDINDPGTRDLYFDRYGPLPATLDVAGARFILLNSSWIPEGDEPTPSARPFVRGFPLQPEQIEFLESELAREPVPLKVFLFMHHLLWWSPDAPWWTDVHPTLVRGGATAVFGGDFGPMKFSHLSRDGIDYYQVSIEGEVDPEMLRAREASRILSQQFDCFLHVVVDDQGVTYKVVALGETSLDKFTPDLWRSAYDPEATPLPPFWMRVWKRIGTPRRLAGLALIVALIFSCGFVTARMVGSRKGP